MWVSRVRLSERNRSGHRRSISSSRVRTHRAGDSNTANRSNSRRDRWVRTPATVTSRRTKSTVTDPKLELTPKEAGPQYEPGDYFDEEVTPKDFGRIAAQTAKQVIVQRIREAERDTVYNKYAAKLNDIVTGTVQRFEQRNMYVLLDGKDEAMLPLSEQVPRENFRINDFIRAYVLDVRKSPKGPSVILSRSAEGLVQRLLEFNVPEVEDGTVEIMAIAREPGSRTKVAVRSVRAEVDPIGAVLGP